MIRNLKALGLALAAVFALSALAASAASAAPGQFTSGSDATTVTAESGSHVFETPAGKWTCTVAKFAGTGDTAQEALTLSAEYGGCKVAGIFNATVNMTSCDYLFHAGSQGANADIVNGSMDVACGTAGDTIDINIPIIGCQIKIFAQSGRTGLAFTNNTSGATKDLGLDLDVANIAGSQNSSCPGGAQSFTTGTYTSPTATTVIGKDAGGSPVNVTVDPES